jgi:hypothetical protein
MINVMRCFGAYLVAMLAIRILMSFVCQMDAPPPGSEPTPVWHGVAKGLAIYVLPLLVVILDVKRSSRKSD